MCGFSEYLIEEGKIEGKIEGQTKGIVVTCKKYGGTLDQACELLMEDEELSLSAEEAKALVEKFWNN